MPDEEKKTTQPSLHEKLPVYSPHCLFLFRCHLRDEMCVKNSSHYFYLFADICTQIDNAMKIHLGLQTLCNVRSYQGHRTFPLQVLSANDQEDVLSFFCQDQNTSQCLLANCFQCSTVGSLESFLTFQQKKSARLLSCSCTDRQVLLILFDNSVIMGHLWAISSKNLGAVLLQMCNR